MELERAKGKPVVISDFGGMNSDSDPRDLPRNQFQYVENIVLEGRGRVVSRRGMTFRQSSTATNLTPTKVSHCIFRIGVNNWLVYDNGSASFKFIDALGAGTSTYSYSPTSWHSEKMCFAQTSNGELIVANGVDRPWKHNGLTGTSITTQGPATVMGIDPPSAAPSVTAGAGGGATEGSYLCAYRYVDRYDNPSVLSPTVEVAAVKDDKFTWSWSNSSGLPSSGRVTKVQIFRTLVDDASTFYMVAEITDGSTSYSDTLSDDSLSANAVLPILNDDQSLNANRFVVPPSHLPFVVWHQDRLWFMGSRTISAGTLSFTSGSGTVTGSGTSFSSSMIGWEIWPTAATAVPYKITAVASSTSITVSPAADFTASGQTYVARPQRLERNRLYYSESDEPESVPQSQNYVTIQINRVDEDDDITGGYSLGTMLCVAKARVTYGVSSVRQPNLDANVRVVAHRGLLNNWCCTQVEGMAFCIDQLGVYAHGGGGDVQDLSGDIHNYFHDHLIDFTKSDKFFAAACRETRTVRFYVILTGSSDTYPRTILCYSYDQKCWWIETRPWQITGAGNVRSSTGFDTYYELPVGYAPVFDDGYPGDGYAGSHTEMVVDSYVGGYVGGSLRATSTAFSVTGIVGTPITMTSGPALGQTGVITVRTSSTIATISGLTIDPEQGDTFNVGGINWKLKSAQFDVLPMAGERAAINAAVWFTPTTHDDNWLRFRHYLDHRTTADPSAVTSPESGDFMALVEGENDATMSMYIDKNPDWKNSGLARKTLSLNTVMYLPSVRHMTFELASTTLNERHEINQLDFEGVV